MSIALYKKRLLWEFVDKKCEECIKSEELKLSEVEIHKINPELGYKDHRNLKVLCIKHHKIHSSAQRISSGIQGR